MSAPSLRLTVIDAGYISFNFLPQASSMLTIVLPELFFTSSNNIALALKYSSIVLW